MNTVENMVLIFVLLGLCGVVFFLLSIIWRRGSLLFFTGGIISIILLVTCGIATLDLLGRATAIQNLRGSGAYNILYRDNDNGLVITKDKMGDFFLVRCNPQEVPDADLVRVENNKFVESPEKELANTATTGEIRYYPCRWLPVVTVRIKPVSLRKEK